MYVTEGGGGSTFSNSHNNKNFFSGGAVVTDNWNNFISDARARERRETKTEINRKRECVKENVTLVHLVNMYRVGHSLYSEKMLGLCF